MDIAIQKEGLKLVLLLRLCPLIPFTIFNFMMGITAISFSDYCIGLIGIIPGTIVYVFIGTTLSDIQQAATGAGDWKNNKMILAFIIVGTLMAIGGIVWVTIVTRRQLKVILAQARNEQEEQDPLLQAQPRESTGINEEEGKRSEASLVEK